MIGFLQNSNNHVGNYEIDRFPFPIMKICSSNLRYGSDTQTAKLANDEQESKIEAILGAYIAASFEITFEELEILLKRFEDPLNAKCLIILNI